MSNKIEGEIVFYSDTKQFGFIKPDGSEGDIFFHVTTYDCDNDPVIGHRVAFLVEDDPRRQGRRRAKAVVPC